MSSGNGDLLGFDNLSASDPADNLTLLRGVSFSGNIDNQVTADSRGFLYGYDLDGNATTEEGALLQYDDAGHLTAYDDNVTGAHLTMGYRPDGLRAWKQIGNGPRTYFYYDGDQLAFEIVNASPTGPEISRVFGWGAAGLEQVDYINDGGEPRYFYLFDPQGNTVHRVFQKQALDLTAYDAFGNPVTDLSFNANTPGQLFDHSGDPVGWGGQWGAYTDLESGKVTLNGGTLSRGGLLLLTHRYYNPDTGRFLTRDPMGYEGGVNVYAYTRNNPVNKIDPSGYQALDSPEASFYAAMRQRAWNKAAYYMNDLATSGGTQTTAFKRVAAAFFGSPRVKQVLAEAFKEMEATFPNVPGVRNAEGAGGVICDIQAQRYMNVLLREFPELEKEVIETWKVQAVNGGKIMLTDSSEQYIHHTFIRVGDMVVDSLNKGHPENWDTWMNRFQTPIEKISVLGFTFSFSWHRMPFKKYYGTSKIDTTSGEQ